MSRKSRQRKNRNSNPPKKQSSTATTDTDRAESAIAHADAEAKEIRESTPKETIENVEGGVDAGEPPPLPGEETDDVDPTKLVKDLIRSTADVRRARKLAEQREKDAAAAKTRHDNLLEEIKERSEGLKQSEELCGELEKELKEREEAILAREADADAGFISRQKELLSKLEQQVAGYATELAKHSERLTEQREEILARLTDERKKLDSERETAEAEMREKTKDLSAKLRKVNWEREDLESEKKAWGQRLEERVRAGIDSKLGEIESLTDRVKQLEKELEEAHKIQSQLGHNDPEKLRRKMEVLQKQNKDLKDQLANSTPAIDAGDYDSVKKENERLKNDRDVLMQRNQELNLREGKVAIGVAELENLRDQREAWTVRESALRANIETLKEELSQYVEQSKAREVFPECAQMDNEEELQSPPSLAGTGAMNLKDFVDRSRLLIAANGFYYQKEDIRAFVAGLATTRLHILQGISGTGKTSLPREFAKAVGWNFRIIEVQSGWRDRQDLLGYYNSFEHRFYESPFMQALYEAACPARLELPTLIVLDEMNLSHPEHYFADFLSTLENEKPGHQSVPLLASRLRGSPAPQHLWDGGKTLPVPANCWFIGTANQDETTKDFADKTYDRANVMEFPRNPDRFDPGDVSPFGAPISYEALQEAFKNARENHSETANAGLRIMKDEMQESLHALDIGWGNRFEAQARSYLPVVAACGGTVGEGLDYLMAHKLLRKLKDRFDLPVGKLEKLSKVIDEAWSVYPELKETEPGRCRNILKRETERLSSQA